MHQRLSRFAAQYLETQNNLSVAENFSPLNDPWDALNSSTPAPCTPASPTHLPASSSNQTMWGNPPPAASPGGGMFSEVSVHDILMATSPTPNVSFESTLFNNHEPQAPSTADAQRALQTLHEHMKQGDPLTPFDFLCFEHLRERVLGSGLPIQWSSTESQTCGVSMAHFA